MQPMGHHRALVSRMAMLVCQVIKSLKFCCLYISSRCWFFNTGAKTITCCSCMSGKKKIKKAAALLLFYSLDQESHFH